MQRELGWGAGPPGLLAVTHWPQPHRASQWPSLGCPWEWGSRSLKGPAELPEREQAEAQPSAVTAQALATLTRAE